jgi:hypothetical protein
MKKIILATTLILSSSVFAQTDKQIADELFSALGDQSFMSAQQNLYLGGPPHGPVRAVVEGSIKGNKTIVKFNYGGPDITADKVSTNPKKWLKAITVMQKRSGYDSANKDWFWAKYKPNGEQLKVGKVEGCIACHKSASGNDYTFAHNEQANAKVTIIKEKSWFNRLLN